ncbi:MAG: glycosyltransferase [Coriobacteriia bacterium]|nr:glycosyltransferase [Coriobacteriia bacterium]
MTLKKGHKASDDTVLFLTSHIAMCALAHTNYFASWIEGFRLNKFATYLFAFAQTSPPIYPLKDLRVGSFLAPYKDKNISLDRGISEVITQLKPNVVIMKNDLKTLSEHARTIKELGVPRLILSSGESPYIKITDDSLRESIVQTVNETVDAVIVVSDYLRDRWIELGCPAEKFFVSNTPIRTSLFAPYKERRTLSSSALYCGNLAHQEIDNLFEIVRTVRKIIPDFTLDIYGTARADTTETFRARVVAEGLEGCLSFCEPLVPVKLYRKMSKAQVLLLPRAAGEYSSAGFPNKLGEYLASGAPVVTTDVGAIGTFLTPMQHAYVVAPGDNALFSDYVIRALTHRQEALAIGQRGRSFIQEQSDCKVVAQRFIDWLAL